MSPADVIGSMDPTEAVQLFRMKDRRLDAMRALVGGVSASDLRAVVVTNEVRDALISGTADPCPPVRWGCLQLLDHLSDRLVLSAICQALEDPVPRVRRLAAHALGCHICKPAWDGDLPSHAVDMLAKMASSDANAKVRAEARGALACWMREHSPSVKEKTRG